jgi:hypothetical protein
MIAILLLEFACSQLLTSEKAYINLLATYYGVPMVTATVTCPSNGNSGALGVLVECAEFRVTLSIYSNVNVI